MAAPRPAASVMPWEWALLGGAILVWAVGVLVVLFAW